MNTVNGREGPTVVLAASDVGAYPSTGGIVTGTTDLRPTSGHPLTAHGSDAIFRVTDAGHPYSNSLRASFYNLGVGDTTTPFGGGVRVLGMQNASTIPTSNPSNGIVAYAEGGVLKVRQSDGKTFPVTPAPNEFGPVDHGLVAWAFDPALTHSVGLFTGSGPVRVTAVRVRQTAPVSRVVWHATGYAGGLTSGSWAAIYNASGTRVGATGDMSTATYEPAEAHNDGGATISSPLTSSVTLAAGIYYVAWRMTYSTSAGDGPMLLAAESSAGSSPNFFGLNTLRRFGYFATGAAAAPATITLSSLLNGANRFWVALA
ncbi:hypothetical protein [Streptomyces nitrosporeus]|uniref:hypothetical protein n=1 Tax=Streptomyces nitrosporeus TaxID=28894 RepID=UPI00332D25F3